MRNGRNEQHDTINRTGNQLNGIVNHGRNYLGNDIPNTKQRCKNQQNQNQQGMFIFEGTKVVERKNLQGEKGGKLL